MIGPKEVEAAWTLIRPHVRRTPILELAAGTFGLSMPLALKLEQLQVSGSFKGRGAGSSSGPPSSFCAKPRTNALAARTSIV